MKSLPFPPLEWRLRARVYRGVIAGGCLRDLYLGRPIKDVDIFVAAPDMRARKEGIFEIIDKPFRDANDLIESFDIGLCQIAYDLEAGYITSPTFWRDVEDKTLTVFSKHLKHLGRLAEKYPDYRIIDRTAKGARGDFIYGA